MNINLITRIFIADCSAISGYLRLSETEAKIADRSVFKELTCIKPYALLGITDKTEDKNHLYTAKLVFQTITPWLTGAQKKSFLCETVDGDLYLIGISHRPYPVVTQQQIHPNNTSDSQLTEVTVTWDTPKMPPVLR